MFIIIRSISYIFAPFSFPQVTLDINTSHNFMHKAVKLGPVPVSCLLHAWVRIQPEALIEHSCSSPHSEAVGNFNFVCCLNCYISMKYCDKQLLMS